MQAKGPAVKTLELSEAASKVNSNIQPVKKDSNQLFYSYTAFSNDPVATLIGHSPNGETWISVKEIPAMIDRPVRIAAMA
ncbi:hypothetical protein GCM10027296_39130 [Chitinimonas naiadis]